MVYDGLRFVHDALQMLGAVEALGINFVDVLRARGPGGKPAIGGDDLDAAQGLTVGGCVTEDVLDFFACEFSGGDLRRRKRRQQPLLLWRGGCFYSI